MRSSAQYNPSGILANAKAILVHLVDDPTAHSPPVRTLSRIVKDDDMPVFACALDVVKGQMNGRCWKGGFSSEFQFPKSTFSADFRYLSRKKDILIIWEVLVFLAQTSGLLVMPLYRTIIKVELHGRRLGKSENHFLRYIPFILTIPNYEVFLEASKPEKKAGKPICDQYINTVMCSRYRQAYHPSNAHHY